MKKTLLTLILFVIGFAYAQKTRIKIICTGDSHAYNSWPLTGGDDSIWMKKMVYLSRQYYDTVDFINMVDAGGRSIYSAMPMWYTSSWGNAEAQYSIDTVLKQHPDLIILSMSGNHTVNHMPADSAIYCFKYIIDTCRQLGVPLIISGQPPRKKTFTGGMTIQGYYDSSKKINDFLAAYAPKSYVNNYSIEDTAHLMYPYYNMLCSDSLHFSDLGNKEYYLNHINTYVFDSLLTDFKGSSLNFQFKKNGSDLLLAGTFRYRKITISGSNDYATFTKVKIFTSANRNFESMHQTFTDAGYLWYKVEVFSGRRIYTVTKRIN